MRTTRKKRNFNLYKTTHYLPAIKAQLDALYEAKQKGVKPPVEIVYLSDKDHILEGAYSSFLAFKKDTLLVPKNDKLPSITQNVVLKIAREYFDIEYTEIPYESLSSLTEVFFASSVTEIRSITRLDEFTFPCGKNTQFLNERFNEYVEKQDWSLLPAFSYEPLISCS